MSDVLNSAPVLDEKMLLELAENIPATEPKAIIRSFYTTWKDSYADVLPRIRNACEREDAHLFIIANQRLAKSASKLGYFKIAKLCSNNGIAARGGRFHDWENFPSIVEAAYQETVAATEALLARSL